MYSVQQTDRWWKANKLDIGKALVGDIKSLQEKLRYRSDRNLDNLRLYSNQNVQSLQGDGYDQSDPFDPDRLVLNICQSVVNAVTAKISTNRPRCMPLTEGGNWELQQQAKQLGKFFDGQFYQSQIYRNSRDIFRDACIYGTGAIKFHADWRDKENPQIAAERKLIDNILVDPIDGRYGRPRMLHEVVEISREVALATWPDRKREIKAATLWGTEQGGQIGYADPITIGEGWHLPSSPTSGDGRHVIACDSGPLLDEPWRIERFPTAFFRWLVESLGFYGGALIDQEKGIQTEINKILLKISQHMHLASSFIMANRGAKVVKEHLVNTPWTLLEYTGDAPVFATVQSISPEYFMQLDRLYAKAFEIAGITQLFATGLKPKGLDSGKAQREYKDTESERFMDVSQAWEELHFRDIPEILVDIAQEIDEAAEGGYSVLAVGEDDTLERIAWQDVNLEREKYILQLHPTSFLPKQPAFKFQAVKEILEVSPEMQPYALELLDYPDLKAKTKQITAPTRYIEKVTDRMLYGKGDDLEALYEPPDAFTKPELAMEIARGKLLDAKINNAPPERLELLMRYMTEVEALQEQLKEEAMAQAAAAMQPQVPPQMAMGAGPGVPAVPGIGEVNIRPEFNMPEAPMPIPGR
jgi:hypothetical protein